MTTATVTRTTAVNKTDIDVMAQNLFNRRFFYEKEGCTALKFNALQRAWEAVKAECMAGRGKMDLATRIWNDAAANAARQLGEISDLKPDTLQSGTHVSHFDRPAGYEQADYIAEVNSLYEALGGWEEEENEYDGTDLRAVDARYKALTSSSPELPTRRSNDSARELMEKLLHQALDDGLLELKSNAALRKLFTASWAATLMLPKLYVGWDDDNDRPIYAIDTTYRDMLELYIQQEGALSDQFIDHLTAAEQSLTYLNIKLKWGKLLNSYYGYYDTIRRQVRRVRGHFYDFNATLEDPEEWNELKDAREVQLIDYTPQSVSPDLSLQLRHQGWTFNRKATVGIGTSHPIQKLFHMSTDVFYAHLRLREAPITHVTHKTVVVDHYSVIPGPTKDGTYMTNPITHTTKEAMPIVTEPTLAHLPKAKLTDLIAPTAYMTGKDGKKANLPNLSIDNYVRALAIARWHDELYDTSYFGLLAKGYTDSINFSHQVLDLAIYAVQAAPIARDLATIKLFAKEEAFLAKHRYGYFHSKAA